VITVDPDIGVPARHHHVLTQCPSQPVQRLSQCASRVRLILLGPQQPEQGIPSMKAAGVRNNKVGEQRNKFGLHDDGVQRVVTRLPQADLA
jgi:hypothetical protein